MGRDLYACAEGWTEGRKKTLNLPRLPWVCASGKPGLFGSCRKPFAEHTRQHPRLTPFKISCGGRECKAATPSCSDFLEFRSRHSGHRKCQILVSSILPLKVVKCSTLSTAMFPTRGPLKTPMGTNVHNIVDPGSGETSQHCRPTHIPYSTVKFLGHSYKEAVLLILT